tara:strand:+ start:3949 stop:4206 length:258 start_codon:yes stop_codon:yes gene_type:complete
MNYTVNTENKEIELDISSIKINDLILELEILNKMYSDFTISVNTTQIQPTWIQPTWIKQPEPFTYMPHIPLVNDGIFYTTNTNIT